MTDALNYVVANPAWAQENHLAVSGAGGQPTYSVVDVLNKRIWYMKGTGFPWDMNTWDENFIYQSITENVWTNASTFKMFASKSYPSGNGGIAWLPRYLNGFNAPLITPDSTYRTYSGCTTFAAQTLGGMIMTTAELGLALIEAIPSFGTALDPATPVLVQRYFWGPGYVNMEVNVYALGYGHVQWQLWTLVAGVYALKQTSLFNTMVAASLPELSFPCGVPVIS